MKTVKDKTIIVVEWTFFIVDQPTWWTELPVQLTP